MKCPICKKEVASGNPDLPFCSERCRLLDLGKWASEEYVISTPVQHTPQPPLAEDEEDL
jgi:hypothetical protein